MSSSEKSYLERDFAADVYLSEATLPPMTPYTPLLHTVHVYTVCILIHTGKGEGELTREKVRAATVHKARAKIPTECITSL
jgi:hypothetical protein